ncbi:helix-turn-helix transcriptional regulator [Vagococcus sp. BWB3-3]|uniref:Helix-turn-helix transcriptional regulator n=1 Tax=Vagococcus allomyrinae TaxID=2794353 RepID=A0A940SV72_9ENTE|nr:helix-turn-helix transcriptional regulator [Vagococcus allomyrinae]
MYDFGSVIKKMRKERHFTQKMLAESICSQSVLSRIENNEEVPNVVVMQQLCRRLEVSIDQVLNQDSNTIKKNNEWLDLMTYYYQIKQFNELNKLVSQEYIVKQLYSDEERQKHLYYCAMCLYHLKGNLEGTLELLQKSLNYTYTTKKKVVSDIEILLLSELARVYFELGQGELGDFYFKKSVALFYTVPDERCQVELTKIFYNAAAACIEVSNYDLAMELIDQGISWSRKKNSYYFLEELLMLKGIILEDHNQLDEAIRFVEMAEMLKEIATSKELLFK